MVPYVLLLLILFTFSILDLFKVGDNLRIGIWYISFLSLVLFSGLRYDVGMDYSSYKELYYDSFSGLNSEIKEIGWAFLFHFFCNIGCPFGIIVLLISFASIFCMFKFIYRYSPYPFLSILIFFCFTQYYTYSFNVMRQCLATYVFLVSLKHIEERNFWSFTFTLLFLTIFVHTSSIILYPLYFVLHKRFSWWVKAILLLVATLSSKFVIYLFLQSETYKIYLSFDNFSNAVSITTYILLLIGMSFFLLEICIKKWSRREVILLNMSFCFSVFLLITFVFENTPLIIVFERIAYYFTPVLIVIIPMVIKRFFTDKSTFLLLPIVSIVYALFFCYTLDSGGVKNNLLPYKSIFSIIHKSDKL